MTNPFEDPAAEYLVLVNADGAHSLWPARFTTPRGWTATHGPAGREDCMQHIATQWTDMRPRHLASRLADEKAVRG